MWFLCNIKFFGCAICLDSSTARKKATTPPKVMQFFLVRLLSYFQAKIFPLDPILSIDKPIVYILIF